MMDIKLVVLCMFIEASTASIPHRTQHYNYQWQQNYNTAVYIRPYIEEQRAFRNNEFPNFRINNRPKYQVYHTSQIQDPGYLDKKYYGFGTKTRYYNHRTPECDYTYQNQNFMNTVIGKKTSHYEPQFQDQMPLSSILNYGGTHQKNMPNPLGVYDPTKTRLKPILVLPEEPLLQRVHVPENPKISFGIKNAGNSDSSPNVIFSDDRDEQGNDHNFQNVSKNNRNKEQKQVNFLDAIPQNSSTDVIGSTSTETLNSTKDEFITVKVSDQYINTIDAFTEGPLNTAHVMPLDPGENSSTTVSAVDVPSIVNNPTGITNEASNSISSDIETEVTPPTHGTTSKDEEQSLVENNGQKGNSTKLPTADLEVTLDRDINSDGNITNQAPNSSVLWMFGRIPDIPEIVQ